MLTKVWGTTYSVFLFLCPGYNVVVTGCQSDHSQQALSCKMSAEYDGFMASDKRWDSLRSRLDHPRLRWWRSYAAAAAASETQSERNRTICTRRGKTYFNVLFIELTTDWKLSCKTWEHFALFGFVSLTMLLDACHPARCWWSVIFVICGKYNEAQQLVFGVWLMLRLLSRY